MSTNKHIFQFKIILKETDPVIWRRILVPGSYTFWDLHVAIQDSMGWQDCHLHHFKIKRPHARKATEIGIFFDTEFEDFMKIMADPSHEEHDETVEWYGKLFDPEGFAPDQVKFDNPQKRWRNAFGARAE